MSKTILVVHTEARRSTMKLDGAVSIDLSAVQQALKSLIAKDCGDKGCDGRPSNFMKRIGSLQ